MKPCALRLTLACSTTLHAQDGDVGVPVDMLVSNTNVFGGGCDPVMRATLYMPLLPVEGVVLYDRVVSTSGGASSMVLGPLAVLNAGGAVHFPTTQHIYAYNAANQGGLKLRSVRRERRPPLAGPTLVFERPVDERPAAVQRRLYLRYEPRLRNATEHRRHQRSEHHLSLVRTTRCERLSAKGPGLISG